MSTKSDQKSKPPATEGLHNLKNCFNVILDRKKLVVKREELENILQTNLYINTAKLNTRLISVLADSLVMYMKLWPGWQKSAFYFTGKLAYNDWFERFRQYLIYKMNFIITREQDYLDLMRGNGSSSTAVDDVQTDEIKKKEIASYSLTIHGQPSMLNNLIFLQRGVNDLEIKEHPGKPWQGLSLKEFLNWLYVSCEVNLPDIKFTRSNMHQFYRYVGLINDATVYPSIKKIESVSKIEENLDTEVYSLDYLHKYYQELFDILSKIKGVSSNRIEELKQIFVDFLADIGEAMSGKKDMITMATNVRVVYHIGSSKYFRNKRMTKNTGATPNVQISSYEIILPKVEFALHRFVAVQDMTDTRRISFNSLNRIRAELDKPHSSLIAELIATVNNSSVTFRCNLCEIEFTGSHAGYYIVTHFQDVHKAEQSVLCIRCRKQHEIVNLTRFRWCHDCVSELHK